MVFDVSKPAVDVLQSVEDAESHSVTSQAEPWMRTFRFDGKLPKPCESKYDVHVMATSP